MDIHLNRPNMTPPTDNIYYVAASNGCFKRIRNDFYDATIAAPKALLEKLDTQLKVFCPKLPVEILRQAELFFSAVYDRQKSEAIMLLALSMEDKRWVPIIPEQKTRGLHVDYDVPTDLGLHGLPDHYHIFGSIHSHADVSSFHSSTDDKDELHADGFHVVIGHLDKKERDMCCRFMIHGQAFKAELKDWIEQPVVAFDQTWMTKVTEVKTVMREQDLGWWGEEDYLDHQRSKFHPRSYKDPTDRELDEARKKAQQKAPGGTSANCIEALRNPRSDAEAYRRHIEMNQLADKLEREIINYVDEERKKNPDLVGAVRLDALNSLLVEVEEINA